MMTIANLGIFLCFLFTRWTKEKYDSMNDICNHSILLPWVSYDFNEIWNGFIMHGPRCFMYNILIHGLCKEGNILEAFKLKFEIIANYFLNDDVYIQFTYKWTLETWLDF